MTRWQKVVITLSPNYRVTHMTAQPDPPDPAGYGRSWTELLRIDHLVVWASLEKYLGKPNRYIVWVRE